MKDIEVRAASLELLPLRGTEASPLIETFIEFAQSGVARGFAD